MKKNVILIGYMGAGKTTIGKALAESLHWKFCDTDEQIVEKAGKPITEIFAQDGEEAFRRIETEVLAGNLQEEQVVFSVGGGLPTREENRRLLKELGVTVYLKVSPETVAKRLTGDLTRPLLLGTDIRSKAEEMLQVRDPLYQEAADQVLCCDFKEKEQILAEISQKLLEFFPEE